MIQRLLMTIGILCFGRVFGHAMLFRKGEDCYGVAFSHDEKWLESIPEPPQ